MGPQQRFATKQTTTTTTTTATTRATTTPSRRCLPEEIPFCLIGIWPDFFSDDDDRHDGR